MVKRKRSDDEVCSSFDELTSTESSSTLGGTPPTIEYYPRSKGLRKSSSVTCLVAVDESSTTKVNDEDSSATDPIGS
jgi:hypothetical protein